MTIVFWDVSGFSTLCNDLDDSPEAINYLLDQYFSTAIAIVQKYNGLLDKFIGDGILAYFGYNNSSTRSGDPYGAIWAALEFKRWFRQFRHEFEKYCKGFAGVSKKINIDLKCGMHNGPAFLHYFNTDMRNSIIILGRTVNFASRLEDIAMNDEILISNKLKNMMEDDFELDEISIEDRRKDGIKSFEDEKKAYVVFGGKDKSQETKITEAVETKTREKSFVEENESIKRQLETAADLRRRGNRVSIDLSKAEILNFSLPNELIQGQSYEVNAVAKGIAKDAFLDLLLIDPQGTQYWFPDPKSYDQGLDRGKLQLNVDKYESRWKFNTPETVGNYQAIMLICEDYGRLEDRSIISLEEKRVRVVSRS